MANENGAAYAVFSVRLSGASDSLINVDWHTEDGTGQAGTDYKATSGTVTFQPGETEKQIQVEVYGRTPGDSIEERTFLIRLLPPIGAVLEAATAECSISVVTEDDAVFTVVYLPAGPRGGKGLTGLNTFELAKLNGFAGTLGQWLATVTGRNIELQKSATHIQWRPVDTENPQPWQDLVALSEIEGTPGDDGREVQLQKSSTAIQWRYTGETVWHDLVQLADLKADPQPLKNRSNWVSGTTYNPGDYVAATATASSAKSLYFLIDAAPYVSNAEPKSDLTHWLELSPPQGPQGNNIELQKTATYIQWRVVGAASWTNLVALADLTGTPGTNGKNIELQQTASYIQWRLVGDTTWTNLVALADITGTPGTNGKQIEMQKGATAIQWRYAGDTAWIDLVQLSDLTGAPGTAGAVWLSGTTVPAGSAGSNGDMYLRTSTGDIYKKVAGSWGTPIMTIAGSSSTGIQWFSGTTNPANTTGKDGDLHLNKSTGEIRERTTTSGTTSWNVIATIPKFATSQEGKDATRTDVAATPVNVREFMEQYGFTSSYMNNAADLNTITSTTDRTVCFGFTSSTDNIPLAGAYGRGIMIAGGGNYSTQIAWVNGTNDQYVRFHNGTTWSAWSKQAFNENDLINTAWTAISLLNGWSVSAGHRCVYRKVLGMVFVEGSIKPGTATAGTPIFVLPTGYRPPYALSFVAFAAMSGTGVPPLVSLDNAGNATINFVSAGTGELSFNFCFAIQ